jgi:predicted ArsR family transcriptional regulator
MKTALEHSDRQFLERMRKLGSATVGTLCEEFGVTATAVRQRLARMQALKYLERETVRTGRGRPSHRYQLTEDGLRQLGDNYAELAVILWRELRRIEDAEIRGRVVDRVRRSLVSRYGSAVNSDSLPERMTQLQTALVQHDFDVEVDTSGALPVLRENNCPYHDLAISDSEICELERSVFGQLLGAELELTQCCLNGHSCCEFQLAEK